MIVLTVMFLFDEWPLLPLTPLHVLPFLVFPIILPDMQPAILYNLRQIIQCIRDKPKKERPVAMFPSWHDICKIKITNNPLQHISTKFMFTSSKSDIFCFNIQTTVMKITTCNKDIALN